MFYIGYQASRLRATTINVGVIPSIEAQALTYCQENPDRPVAQAFAQAYQRTRRWRRAPVTSSALLSETGEVEVKTAFLVYRSHLETDHQLLSGCREDLLRKVDGAWKVARRTIVLDANVLPDKNLSVFL
jgi:Ring hydroxylating beta subunit